ncbi:MAG: alanine racemase [Chloroflexota bacterium]|nr:alanine racemase [Chloroflexota bacterium]
MERPIFQPVGTPVESLDTPALVVDLDIMESNIDTLHDSFRQLLPDGETPQTDACVRPHVSCHGCPEIALRQVSADEGLIEMAPSCTGGIAVATLGEAEVFASAGFNDILITGRVITGPKIRRLLALARDNWVFQAVDNLRNVQNLSDAAAAEDAILGILVDIDAGYGHGGVSSAADALTLAQAVEDAPGLALMGLMTYEGPYAAASQLELQEESLRRLRVVNDAREQIEGAGIEITLVSAGSTYNYDVAARIPGVTEVMAGVYPLMDGQMSQFRPELQPAARVLSTVISHPVPGRAVVDAGHKTTGPDFGVAALHDVPGAVATRFSAEHGILELEGEATGEFNPNDKVWLVPYNLSLCVNQFDYFRAVRDGKLVGYWPISARGRLD